VYASIHKEHRNAQPVDSWPTVPDIVEVQRTSQQKVTVTSIIQLLVCICM